ncbi:MAG: YARHG domain-containing protein [Cyclobacteriaceae bacterium]
MSQNNFGGGWTDGSVGYSTEFLSDGIIQFYGGNLHEGGYRFYGRTISENQFEILGAYVDCPNTFPCEPSYGELHEKLEYRKIDGNELLILKDEQSDLKNILIKSKVGLRDLVNTNKINHQLAGKYRNRQTGQIVTFSANYPNVEGLTEGKSYTFETDYDFPMDAIKLTETSLFFEKTNSGLSLFKAMINEYDELEQGELIYELDLLERISFVKSELPGDFAFASLTPLIDDILFHYSLAELRLMRNEIFARYGHKFKSQDLNEHFYSKLWYRPTDTDATNELTELERINVQQIRNVEARIIQLQMSNNPLDSPH